MTTLPTTAAMIAAAEEAYDIACADAAVAAAKHEAEGTVETYARSLITHRAEVYARAVLLSAIEDMRATA